MKTIATALLTLLVSLQMVAGKVIKIQDIEYAPSWMTIKEVELTKGATIIRGTLQPDASILNNTVIVDRNTGKEYKFLRVEGINVIINTYKRLQQVFQILINHIGSAYT